MFFFRKIEFEGKENKITTTFQAQGVFIEWSPYEEGMDSGWVIPGENGQEESIRASPPSLSPNNVRLL